MTHRQQSTVPNIPLFESTGSEQSCELTHNTKIHEDFFHAVSLSIVRYMSCWIEECSENRIFLGDFSEKLQQHCWLTVTQQNSILKVVAVSEGGDDESDGGHCHELVAEFMRGWTTLELLATPEYLEDMQEHCQQRLVLSSKNHASVEIPEQPQTNRTKIRSVKGEILLFGFVAALTSIVEMGPTFGLLSAFITGGVFLFELHHRFKELRIPSIAELTPHIWSASAIYFVMYHCIAYMLMTEDTVYGFVDYFHWVVDYMTPFGLLTQAVLPALIPLLLFDRFGFNSGIEIPEAAMTFVRQQRLLGVSDDQIDSLMLENGWDNSDWRNLVLRQSSLIPVDANPMVDYPIYNFTSIFNGIPTSERVFYCENLRFEVFEEFEELDTDDEAVVTTSS